MKKGFPKWAYWTVQLALLAAAVLALYWGGVLTIYYFASQGAPIDRVAHSTPPASIEVLFAGAGCFVLVAGCVYLSHLFKQKLYNR